MTEKVTPIFIQRLFCGLGLFLLALPLRGQSARSLSLTDVLRGVQQYSPLLRAEQLNIGLAQTDVITAGLRPNPLLNNQTLQLARPSVYPEGTGPFSSVNRQVWWQVTTPINVAQQRQKSVRLAEQTVELTRRNVAEVERNLLLQVAQTWLSAWNARRSLDLIAQSQQNLDTLVRLSEVRLRNQVITQTDLLRTQVLADQYRLRGRTARQEYVNQLADLRRLLNTTDSIDIAVTNELGILENRFQGLLSDSTQVQALRNRSDVRVVQQAVEVARQNSQLQQALRYPRPELGVIYNPQNSVPYMGFYGTLPLPFFNKNQGNIQRAKLAEDQTRQVAAFTQRQVETEVQIALRSFQTQQGNLSRYVGIRERAAQVLASVRYAYLRGGTTIVDFLDAQRSLLAVQEDYLATEVAYRQSLIQLLFVTGQIQRFDTP